MKETTADFTSVIIATTYSIRDARERLAMMRRFLEDAYYAGTTTPTQERLEEFLDAEGADMATRDALRAWLGAWAGALSRESLYETLGSAAHDLSLLPVLGIVAAVHLPETEMAHLGGWVREYVDPRAFIDFHADPAAVGGCRLMWSGRERDFSLGYFVEKHRDEVVDEIRAVFEKTSARVAQ